MLHDCKKESLILVEEIIKGWKLLEIISKCMAIQSHTSKLSIINVYQSNTSKYEKVSNTIVAMSWIAFTNSSLSKFLWDGDRRINRKQDRTVERFVKKKKKRLENIIRKVWRHEVKISGWSLLINRSFLRKVITASAITTVIIIVELIKYEYILIIKIN